jgi:hypothetical protein
MDLKETIITINQMQADGVIGEYALGGAVGANFYLEPAATEDVDIFCVLEAPPGESILTLTPYDYLTARGHSVTKEGYILVAGWPVQFHPVGGDSLLKEALDRSITKDFAGVPVRVFRPEHLAAIALKLSRTKDKLRLAQLIENHAVNEADLSSVLTHYDLLDRWMQFKKQLNG